MKTVLAAAAAFIIGSVPTGLIIAKSRGIDVTESGSGNIGATNVLRTTGKWPAFFTLLGDALKGVAAALLGGALFPDQALRAGLVGFCAVLGHDFSLFLRFRGGKGVATSLGVLAAYAPLTALFTAALWLAAALLTRYSSLGALVSFGAMPFFISFADTPEKLPVAAGMTALLFLKHRDNIVRLMRGAENRIGGRG